MKVCNKCKIEKELIEFNKEKLSKDGYQGECKSCQSKRGKQYYKENNNESYKQIKKEYYQNNKEIISKREKEYRANNKEKIKKYIENNKENINKTARRYASARRKTDPLYKLKCNLRSGTNKAFRRKGYKKNSKSQEMLGVDWEVCKAHIERQFTKGMNWNNNSEWHIDHIIPLASAKTEEELIKLCHYSNLQPLWAFDNLSKSDKIMGQQNKLRI